MFQIYTPATIFDLFLALLANPSNWRRDDMKGGFGEAEVCKITLECQTYLVNGMIVAEIEFLLKIYGVGEVEVDYVDDYN